MAGNPTVTTGYISENREPILSIDIFDRRERLRRLEAIVDTGFDDFLALPSHLAGSLGLPRLGTMAMRIATEQTEWFNTYSAAVRWCGTRLPIRVLQS